MRRAEWQLRSSARGRGRPALACVAVALATIVPYLPTVPNYFLGDDFGLVWAFHNQAPLNFLSLFVRSWDAGVYGDVPDEIRPLVALTYQLDFFLGAGSPVTFHISNIAYHVVNALLVLALARVVARLSWSGATLSSAVFAVMPIHAETVAWISGRADTIPTLFYLGSLLGFAVWRRSTAPLAYTAALACCFLALFSKQNAITLPLMIVAYDLVLERRWPRRTWSYLCPYLPFVVLTAGYLGLRYALFGNVLRENVMPPPISQWRWRIPSRTRSRCCCLRLFRAGRSAVYRARRSSGRRCRRTPAVGAGPAAAQRDLRTTQFRIARCLDHLAPGVLRPGVVADQRSTLGGHLRYSTAPIPPAVGLAVVVGILFDAACQRVGTHQTLTRLVIAMAACAACLVGLLRPDRRLDRISGNFGEDGPRDAHRGAGCVDRDSHRAGRAAHRGAAPPASQHGRFTTSVPRLDARGSGRGPSRTCIAHRLHRTTSATASSSSRRCRSIAAARSNGLTALSTRSKRG